MKTVFKKFIFVLVMSMMVIVVNKTRSALDRYREIRFVDNRPVFLPKGKTLKWMSMGYRGLVSDWLWIQTVIYYGRRVMDEDNPYFKYSEEHGNLDKEMEAVEKAYPLEEPLLNINEELRHVLYQGKSRGLVNYIYPMLDRVTTLDPHFIFPYIFGGVYLLMDTGDIGAAQRLLDKGYKANPDRWEFPFYLGWIEWMYKGNLQSTNQYLLEAVSREGCPDYVGRLLTGISMNLGRTELTRAYLEGLIGSTDNPEIHERIGILLEQM